MSIIHQETELGAYCCGNCGQGDHCDCELGSPYAGDWVDEHPLLCAIVAVAAVAAAALLSAAYPGTWLQ